MEEALFLFGCDQWNLVASYVLSPETRLREGCFIVATQPLITRKLCTPGLTQLPEFAVINGDNAATVSV